MLWKGRRESGNVEDRRGFGGGRALFGGGIGALVIGVIVYLLGGDPSVVLNQVQESAPQENGQPIELTPQEKEDGQFVGVVLAETEDVWNKIFSEQGAEYVEPKLVLFRDGVQSGCGGANAAVGPFYCPLDSKVYIDLSFYKELKDRFNAPGDFAMAYVIAHEVGHHIQNLMGTSEKVQQQRQRLSEAEGNRLSVMLELQADFYAGVWAHYAKNTKNIIEEGDIEEALNAANAIGDDRLQRESQGRIVPDAFTHGTSQQRMYWFKKGYETGDISQGDTFNDPSL